ncbi:MAG: helix-turn-helix domain-containing protein [Nitrososphaera sp.]|nr:helix-turn-helix domain-containing protein [Nitrososphaera sp.]
MSGIARETGIPFPTVRRAVHTFQNIGVIKAEKRGKKVFVRVTSQDHPFVDSMVKMARWINTVIWDPDTFVARIFAKNSIDYAFVGTSKIKYTKRESRNMVQIAVPKEQYEKAKRIIKEAFDGIGIKTTEDPSKTLGNAMSVIYVKCFPVDGSIGYEEYVAKTADSNEAIGIKVADKGTENRALQQAAAKDTMFIPSSAITP